MVWVIGDKKFRNFDPMTQKAGHMEKKFKVNKSFLEFVNFSALITAEQKF